MIIWGINSSFHDSALSVFSGDELLFASESERFSRVKGDFNLDQKLIDYALNFGFPDEVVLSEKNYLKNVRKFFFGGLLRSGLRLNLGNDYKVFSTYHHESHAAFGYYTSPFDKCMILVIDSIGEFDCLSIWRGEGSEIKKMRSFWYPNSIGLFYSAMTQRIGLKPNEEEYILMGLAAYGDPMKYKGLILGDFFKKDLRLKVNVHRGCYDWCRDLKRSEYKHLAAATQSIYEDYLRMIMLEIKKINFSDNLVFTGGCALNCVANSILYQYMSNVYIPCNPGDAGSSIGAVLARIKRKIRLDNNFLGYEIKKQINYKNIVKELLKNNICGLAIGKAEFGPRSLGHRSLLANPSEKNIIDKLNKIKKRQRYRPFAVSILKEEARKYFQMFNDESPYMQYTYPCFDKDMRDICHVDMTSRIQTVDEKNPILYGLLKEWYEVTKIPYLINTSLNVKGQPILNDENDIIEFEKQYGVKIF